MKSLLTVVGVLLFAMILILSTVAWRYFSSITTRVDVVFPEPGIHCALASTSDGTAISCYPAPVLK